MLRETISSPPGTRAYPNSNTDGRGAWVPGLFLQVCIVGNALRCHLLRPSRRQLRMQSLLSNPQERLVLCSKQGQGQRTHTPSFLPSSHRTWKLHAQVLSVLQHSCVLGHLATSTSADATGSQGFFLGCHLRCHRFRVGLMDQEEQRVGRKDGGGE